MNLVYDYGCRCNFIGQKHNFKQNGQWQGIPILARIRNTNNYTIKKLSEEAECGKYLEEPNFTDHNLTSSVNGLLKNDWDLQQFAAQISNNNEPLLQIQAKEGW